MPQKIVSYLKKAQADVVILIEFGPDKRRLLQQLKTLYPYQKHCAQRWYCSLALLSRHPLSDAHATSPTRTRPALVWGRLALPGKKGQKITVVGTHIYRPSSKPQLHATHMKALAAFLDRFKGPLVVGGDFNATPWSRSYRTFVQDSALQSIGEMLPSWPAWPLATPQFAIDHLFASARFNITAYGLGPSVGSDHLPIWATVKLRSD